MPTTTAVDYLLKPQDFPERPPVAIVFGDDAFLRAEVFKIFRGRVLTEEDAEFSYSEHDGNSDIRFADVVLELSSPPMFGGDIRLVRVTDADRFVSAWREEIRDYLKEPSKVGLLLLQVKTLIKTSNLYKDVDKSGLLIEAKQPDRTSLNKWLETRCKIYNVSAGRGVFDSLIELIGEEPGLLDSEIQRLALLNPPDGKLTADFVSRNVGSWRLQKAWDIIAQALSGDFPTAVRQLDVLLASGEQPIAVLAQMGAVLRKYWAATAYYIDEEKRAPRQSADDLLQKAVEKAKIYVPYKVKSNRAAKEHPISQMKKLSRRRGLRLVNLLLQADLDLKGGQRIDPRIVIEELLAELSSRDLRNGVYLSSKRPIQN